MSQSGSYDFNLQRDNLIKRAFQLINVYGFDDTVSTNDNNYAIDILNMLLKSWQVEGISTWKRKTGYIFSLADTSQYDIGSVSGAEHNTNNYINTTLTTTASATATNLTIGSSTGMASGDNIGIELDDGTRYWTTINGSPGSSTTVTLTSGLTSIASAGATIVTYTSKINRPLKIFSATCIDLTTGTESQMTAMSAGQYRRLPIKTTSGTPNQYFYEKNLGGVLPYYSRFYVYPVPTDVKKVIAFIYEDSFQDMDSSTNDFDLPQEWLLPITYALAVELGYSYGKFTELQQLEPHAKELKENVKYQDQDQEPIKFKLKNRRW